MSTSKFDELVGICRDILVTGMRPLNGRAFERAKDEFHRVYAQVYKPSSLNDHDAAHHEALDEALGAFLGTYESQAANPPRLRVCQRCGQVAPDERAEPICSNSGHVGPHSYIEATREQSAQIELFRDSGWVVSITGARDSRLLVAGFDANGDRFRGHVVPTGALIGEAVTR